MNAKCQSNNDFEVIFFALLSDRNKSDCAHSNCKLNDFLEDNLEPCSNKMIQVVIVILIFIMAIWYVLLFSIDLINLLIRSAFVFSLAAISTLYFVEHNKQHYYTPPTDLLQFSVGGQNLNRGGYGQNVYNSYNGRGIDPNIRVHHRKLAVPPYADNNRVISLSDDVLPPRNSTYHRLVASHQKDLDDTPEEHIRESLPSASTKPAIYAEDEPKNHAQILGNNRRSKDQRQSLVPKTINVIRGGNSVTSAKEVQQDSVNSDANSPYTSEHNELNHNINNGGYLLTDVDTNLIDVGQTGIRDDSKFYFPAFINII